jgi:hypothetical protein
MIVREADIGGATVRRIFTRNGRAVMPGENLSRGEMLSIPVSNRQSLIDNGYVVIYPPRPGMGNDDSEPERFVVSKGFGNFDVIEGRRLNSEPLTKEQAQALADGDAPPN